MRSNRLHAIQDVYTDVAGSDIADTAEAKAEFIVRNFSNKWIHADDAENEEVEQLLWSSRENVEITAGDLGQAMAMVNQRSQLDAAECSPLVLELMFAQDYTGVLPQFCTQLLSDSSMLKQVRCSGYVHGKKAGTNWATQTRATVPSPVVLQICHNLLVLKLLPYIDASRPDCDALYLSAGQKGA